MLNRVQHDEKLVVDVILNSIQDLPSTYLRITCNLNYLIIPA